MTVGVLKETFPGEHRVAFVPTALGPLKKAKLDVIVEAGAGTAAGYPDDAYAAAGIRVGSRADVLGADVIFGVRILGAGPGGSDREAKSGHVWIGMADPLAEYEPIPAFAKTGATSFALELVPRITRAQSMDVLSSQANLAGYKSVVLGAELLPKILPMMTTAAGTIAPARVLILGAGVAGLQAIATAKRLGSVVSAYDVRPETKQQVESLGARFVELAIESAVGEGGYAKQMDEAYYARQRELLGEVIAEQDMVVTTAAVPGRKSPILITGPMMKGMKPGSVIVDLAAERGGNVEGTVAGETVEIGGVRILGPKNLPSSMAFNASALYAKNIATFLMNMVKDGALNIDVSDQIVAESLLTQGGEVVNPRVQALLGGAA